jgi:Meiotically Up-regulated Gene 113 (MUG113) protein
MESVYLMKNMATGYYKIGRSNQPKRRERTLQAQEPDVRLVGKFEAQTGNERVLHQKYASKRLRGEWFALDYGDLFDLSRAFNTDVPTIDPPSEVIAGETWTAEIHKYAPDRFSTRVWQTRLHTLCFEVPYRLSHCDIEQECLAQSWSCDVPPDLCWLLEDRLANVRLEEYCISDLRIELRELISIESQESNGFYVIANAYFAPRYSRRREYAEIFFRRVKRSFDAIEFLGQDRVREH